MKKLGDLMKQLNGDIPEPDSEPNEPIAPVETRDWCDGRGYFSVPMSADNRIVTQGVPHHWVDYVCNHCEAGAAYMDIVMKNKYEREQLPPMYRQATMDDFFELGSIFQDDGSQGKVLAFAALQAFVDHPEHRVSWHEVCRRIQELYDYQSGLIRQHIPDFSKEPPGWVQDDLAESDDIRDGIVLHGDLGVGKTHLAAAALNAINADNGFMMYARMGRIIDEVTETWGTKASAKQAMAKYTETPLLIDDMNLNAKGDGLMRHERQIADEMMRKRTNNRLPTLITTNWTPEQFTDMWGGWNADVVKTYLWVEVRGKKVRKTVKKDRKL